MSVLTIPPTNYSPATLDYPVETPLVSPSTLVKWQKLPPLLSRLPPALLASPESLPIPFTPLALSSKLSTSASTSVQKIDSHETPSIGYTVSHLPAIDEASLALHYALYDFRVTDLKHYATAPYEQAFNWADLRLPLELEREW